MKELGYYDLNFDVNIAIDELFNSFDQVIYLDYRYNVVSDIRNNRIFCDLDYDSIGDAYEFLDRFRDTLVFEEDREIFDSIKTVGRLNAEIRRKRNDGTFKWCYCEIIQIGKYEYMLLFLDLTGSRNDRINAKNKYIEIENSQRMQYKKNSHKYRMIIEQTNVILYEWYPDKDAVVFSDNAKRHFNISIDDSFSLNKFMESDLIHPEDLKLFKKIHAEMLVNPCDTDIEIRLKNYEGNFIWYKVTFSPVTDENGNLIMAVGTILDINEATNYLLKLKYRAEIDSLTGLSNIYKFNEDVDKLLNENKAQYAIIIFDIEKFKAINEIYGMEFADNLLKYIADTVKKSVSPDDLTVRFNGDNFGIFRKYVGDDDIISLIENINSRLSYYKGAALTLVFGIYRIEDNNIIRRKIIDYANMAKSTIKGNNVKCFAFYEDTMLNKILEEHHIENDMEQALKEEQFIMYLQPKYNIKDSSIIGAEALVRWQHPEKGMIMPNNFIGLFEKNGFVQKLDRYMWEQACKLIRRWVDYGVEPVPISVNVSRINVSDPGLVHFIDSLVEKYGIEKKYLELEITETVYFDNQNVLMQTIEGLKDSGYTLLMDDFGSGFSSLNMLKNTPFDVLKIDRDFLNETMITDKGKKIINHTIKLSSDIGMGIVAEGVETKEQAEYLLECGCYTAQGYYYSKPVPVSEFERLFCPDLN